MTHVDPVCGMEIEEEDSVGTVVHEGVTSVVEIEDLKS
jgi:YHS domain-containing protein